MIKLKKDKNTILNISKTRYNNGDVIGALSILHSDKPYAKKDIELYYEQGLIYLKEKNYNSAIDIILLYCQLGNKTQKCKGYNAIGYAFLKQSNFILADAFFNLQLDISVKQVCDFDEQMYEYFSQDDKQKEKDKFKVIYPYEQEYKEGLVHFELDEIDKALEFFDKIPFESKFYKEVLKLKSKIYFKLNKKEKALAYFREYLLKEKNVSVYTYYEFITILAEKDMQEHKYYLQELLKNNEFEGKDNLLVADLVFKLTENYDLVFKCLDEYEKTVKISPITLSLRGVAHLYNNQVGLAKKCIKNAYLYSNLSKYKHILNNTNKEYFIQYPKQLVKEYSLFIEETLSAKKIKASYEQVKDIFEVAIDAENKDFWYLFIKYLEKLNNKLTDFYIKQILVLPDVDLYIKVKAKRILAKKGFIGELIEFNRIPTKAPFIKLNIFKTDTFKNAYIGAYTALFILTNSRYIKKAKQLEEKIKDKQDNFSEQELSAFIMYYLLNDGLRAKSYRDLFGVGKGKILEMSKIFDIKIKRK